MADGPVSSTQPTATVVAPARAPIFAKKPAPTGMAAATPQNKFYERGPTAGRALSGK